LRLGESTDLLLYEGQVVDDRRRQIGDDPGDLVAAEAERFRSPVVELLEYFRTAASPLARMSSSTAATVSMTCGLLFGAILTCSVMP
jgi:hypothetical protein